jgi:hypothetical protein
MWVQQETNPEPLNKKSHSAYIYMIRRGKFSGFYCNIMSGERGEDIEPAHQERRINDYPIASHSHLCAPPAHDLYSSLHYVSFQHYVLYHISPRQSRRNAVMSANQNCGNGKRVDKMREKDTH